MAQRHIVELIDDIEKTPVDSGGGTHSFALDGREYEIDLNEANVERLREALAPFIEAGRALSRKSKGTNTQPLTPGRARSREETEAIRAWARQQGHEVSDRGRIAESIIQAYQNRR